MVDAATPDQISPTDHDEATGKEVRRQRARVTKRLVNLAHQFLQNIAGYARACIDGGKDEHGFEQNGEVEPVTGKAGHAGNAAKDLCHTDCEGDCSAGAAGEWLAHQAREVREINRGQSKLCEGRRRYIDGEVVSHVERTGCDER